MPPKSKAKKKGQEEDFDELLTQFAKTAAADDGKKKKKKDEGISNEQRRSRQRERDAALSKIKQAEMERQLEAQQMQQSRLREMMELMMKQKRPYLSAPDTTVHQESKESAGFSAAAAAMQGWRNDMEDAHTVSPSFLTDDGKTGLFSVFDGHAGSDASKLANAIMAPVLMQHLRGKPIDKEEAYVAAFKQIDESLKKKLVSGTASMGPGGTAGTTAVAVVVNSKQVVCASVGDSRAVLSRGGKAVELAIDHKPETPAERARIEAAGGHVENNRTDGALAMSRALGDFGYKADEKLSVEDQKVSCIPRVIAVPRTAEDDFVLVACDGIFDVLSNEEAIEYVSEQIKQKRVETGVATGALSPATLETIAADLTRHCLAPAEGEQPTRAEGTDNMTAIIAMFK